MFLVVENLYFMLIAFSLEGTYIFGDLFALFTV